MPALSGDFTVYLWDMLGYGTSAMAEGQDVSLAAQSVLLVDLLEHWELADPLVAANSSVFAQVPPALHEALVRAYISGAADRPIAAQDLDMLVAPWLGTDGQAAFRRHLVGEAGHLPAG